MPSVDIIGMGRDLLFNYAGLGAAFFFVILLALVGGLVLYKMKRGEWLGQYPVKVRVWERRGSSWVLSDMNESARARKDENGAWFYEFKKKKVVTQAIAFDYINPDNTLDVIALSRDEYHPFRLFTETAQVKDVDGNDREVPIPKLQPVIAEEFKFAYVARIHKNYNRRPNDDLMAKWGGVITILTVTVCVFLILALVLKEMQPIVTAAGAAAQALAEASKSCLATGTVGVAP